VVKQNCTIQVQPLAPNGLQPLLEIQTITELEAAAEQASACSPPPIPPTRPWSLLPHEFKFLRAATPGPSLS
jgi:hypothetical protein